MTQCFEMNNDELLGCNGGGITAGIIFGALTAFSIALGISHKVTVDTGMENYYNEKMSELNPTPTPIPASAPTSSTGTTTGSTASVGPHPTPAPMY